MTCTNMSLNMKYQATVGIKMIKDNPACKELKVNLML